MENALNLDTVVLAENEEDMIILDQTLLPNETKYLTLNKAEDIWEAIYKLRVRGAPAIGVAGAYGYYVLARQFDTEDMDSKTLNISNIKPINVPSNYELEVLSVLVSGVKLYGPADEIAALSADSVVAQIDCQSVNLTVGQQSIPVTIQIPSSTRIFATGSYTVQCEVVAK